MNDRSNTPHRAPRKILKPRRPLYDSDFQICFRYPLNRSEPVEFNRYGCSGMP
jgi:hypothetical protein